MHLMLNGQSRDCAPAIIIARLPDRVARRTHPRKHYASLPIDGTID